MPKSATGFSSKYKIYYILISHRDDFEFSPRDDEFLLMGNRVFPVKGKIAHDFLSYIIRSLLVLQCISVHLHLPVLY